MNTITKPLYDTEIRIELDNSLKSFLYEEGEKFQKLNGALEDYIQTLLQDLNLPIDITLKFSFLDNSKSELFKYLIYIAHQKCRAPVVEIDAEKIKSEELASKLALIIYENRSLLISRILTDKLIEIWREEKNTALLDQITKTEFFNIVSELIKRGLSLFWLRDFFDQNIEERNELKVSNLLEEEIITIDTLSISLFISKEVYDWLKENENLTSLEEFSDVKDFEGICGIMQDGLYWEMGIVLPKVSLEYSSELKENEYRIQINDIKYPIGFGLHINEMLVNDYPNRMALLGLSGIKKNNPANYAIASIVPMSNDNENLCKRAGLTTWKVGEYLILALSSEVRKNAFLLLTVDIVKYMIEKMEEAFPNLMKSALEYFDIVEIAEFLRELLREQISIRNFVGILENMIFIKTNYYKGLAQIGFVNLLRASLKREISHKFSTNKTVILTYYIDDEIANDLKKRYYNPPWFRDKIISSIVRVIDKVNYSANIIITTSFLIRKKLKNLIEKELPNIHVIAFEELNYDMNIYPMGRISFNP